MVQTLQTICIGLLLVISIIQAVEISKIKKGMQKYKYSAEFNKQDIENLYGIMQTIYDEVNK